MMNRRTLFGAAGAASMAAFFRERAAYAATASATDVELRGSDGRLERLGTLELESQQDFTLGFRVFQAKNMRRTSGILLRNATREAGYGPRDEMPYEVMLKIADANPMINMAQRAWLSNQQVTRSKHSSKRMRLSPPP